MDYIKYINQTINKLSKNYSFSFKVYTNEKLDFVICRIYNSIKTDRLSKEFSNIIVNYNFKFDDKTLIILDKNDLFYDQYITSENELKNISTDNDVVSINKTHNIYDLVQLLIENRNKKEVKFFSMDDSISNEISSDNEDFIFGLLKENKQMVAHTGY